MEHILVLFPTHAHHRAQLRAAGGDAVFCFEDETPSEEFLSRVTMVLGRPPLELLPRLPALAHLQLNSAGVEPYASALPDHVGLTNASGAYGPGIAEHGLGMVLTLTKKLHRYRDNQRASRWESLGTVTSLEEARVLVVGLGDLGRCFARKVHALGARVTGIKRTPGQAPDYCEALYTLDKLDDCLPQADIVYLSLPDTPDTQGLFSRERIEKMKPGAILINVGRGNAVDLDALCDAIEAGRLAGAGVDVTDPEPLPQTHRAWQVEDLLITPHVSGGFFLPQTHDRIVSICADNVGRFCRHEPLRNTVDRKLLY